MGRSFSSVPGGEGCQYDPHTAATTWEAIVGEDTGAEQTLESISKPSRGQKAWKAESRGPGPHSWLEAEAAAAPGLLPTPEHNRDLARQTGHRVQKARRLCGARGPWCWPLPP